MHTSFRCQLVPVGRARASWNQFSDFSIIFWLGSYVTPVMLCSLHLWVSSWLEFKPRFCFRSNSSLRSKAYPKATRISLWCKPYSKPPCVCTLEFSQLLRFASLYTSVTFNIGIAVLSGFLCWTSCNIQTVAEVSHNVWMGMALSSFASCIVCLYFLMSFASSYFMQKL